MYVVNIPDLPRLNISLDVHDWSMSTHGQASEVLKSLVMGITEKCVFLRTNCVYTIGIFERQIIHSVFPFFALEIYEAVYDIHRDGQEYIYSDEAKRTYIAYSNKLSDRMNEQWQKGTIYHRKFI